MTRASNSALLNGAPWTYLGQILVPGNLTSSPATIEFRYCHTHRLIVGILQPGNKQYIAQNAVRTYPEAARWVWRNYHDTTWPLTLAKPAQRAVEAVR